MFDLALYPNRIDSFFDELFPKNKPSLPVGLTQTEDGYSVTLEVPGYSSEDISVQLIGQKLVVSGKTTSNVSYRDFKKTFTIPPGINAEDIEAKLSHGLLEIAIRRIESKAIDIPVH